MDKKITADIKNWFYNYVHTFKYDDYTLQRNINLKEDHTKRVCKEILNIGKQLGLNNDELRLAEIIALLHDVGRFEQYARYKTFNDQQSENHAELGTKILERYDVLNQLDDPLKNLVLQSIKYHNRPSLPQKETETCLFFSKLLRDADKLDIWRVVTDYYNKKKDERNEVIELGLPDTPKFSEKVYKDLMNKKIVDIKHVKNLNDLKLLQTGWIFDINFKPSLQLIQERHYLEMIRDVLPKSEKIQEIFDVIHLFLDNHHGQGFYTYFE